MEKRLEIWSSRNLIIKGRDVLIKIYTLATIMYLANAFQLPQELITRIQKDILKFVWKGRMELINRATMYMRETEGGLVIPKVAEAIKGVRTKWIRNITEKQEKTHRLMWPHYYMGTSLSTVKPEWNFLRDNNSPRADLTNIPPWHKETLEVVKSHQTDFAKWTQQQITSKNIYEAIKKLKRFHKHKKNGEKIIRLHQI